MPGWMWVCVLSGCGNLPLCRRLSQTQIIAHLEKVLRVIARWRRKRHFCGTFDKYASNTPMTPPVHQKTASQIAECKIVKPNTIKLPNPMRLPICSIYNSHSATSLDKRCARIFVAAFFYKLSTTPTRRRWTKSRIFVKTSIEWRQSRCCSCASNTIGISFNFDDKIVRFLCAFVVYIYGWCPPEALTRDRMFGTSHNRRRVVTWSERRLCLTFPFNVNATCSFFIAPNWLIFGNRIPTTLFHCGWSVGG